MHLTRRTLLGGMLAAPAAVALPFLPEPALARGGIVSTPFRPMLMGEACCESILPLSRSERLGVEVLITGMRVERDGESVRLYPEFASADGPQPTVEALSVTLDA